MVLASLPAIRLGLDSLLGDEGFFDLIGRLTASGYVPYRDFEMGYAPLTAWFDGLVWLTGTGWLGMRLTLLAFSCACLVLVTWLGRKLAGSWWWGLYAAGFWVAAQTVPKDWVLYPQFQASVLVVAGLLTLRTSPNGRSASGVSPVIAGVLFGVAAGFKHTFGLLAFLGTLLVLVSSGKHRRARWLTPLGLTLVSILLLIITHQLLLTAGTLVLWTVWMSFAATSLPRRRLGLSIRTTVLFASAFAGVCLVWLLVASALAGPRWVAGNLFSQAQIVRAAYAPLSLTPLGAVSLLPPAAWTLLAALPRISSRSTDPLLFRATVGAAAGGLFAWYPRFDGNHLIGILPVLAPLLPVVLLAFWDGAWRRRLSRYTRAASFRVVAATALVVVLIVPNLGTLRYKASTFVRVREGTVQVRPLESVPTGILGPPELAEEVNATIHEVQAGAGPGARIFAFPAASAIYILADRPMATRQPYLSLLIEDPARQRETLAELQASRPLVVVIDKLGVSGSPAELAFMLGWLRQGYVLTREGSRYDVYVRR